MSRLRVCIVAPSLNRGGIPRVALMQAVALRQLGCDVTLVSLSDYSPWEELIAYAEKHSVEIVFLRDYKLPRGRRTVSYLIRSLGGRVMLPDADFCILHNLVSALAARRCLDRAIYYIHDIGFFPLLREQSWIARWLERWVIKRARVVVCNSLRLREKLEKLLSGKHLEKLHVVPPAVLYNSYYTGDMLFAKKLKYEPQAITVCRFQEVGTVIRRVVESGINKVCKVVIVLYAVNRGSLSRLPPVENVYYYYNVSEHSLWTLYERAWFVLGLHSENFGLFILEGAAAGAIPLIHVEADLGVVRHLPSWCYEYITTATAAEQIRKYIDDLDFLREWMLRIHKYVVENFTWTRHAEQLLDIATRYIVG